VAFDLLIRNGIVVDGSGAPAREADVGIVDGRIAEIGRDIGAGSKVIEAKDRVVAPASSTCTPTMTRRSAGIRRSARRAGTASLA
jgi:predicted amidohydrolase